MSYQPKHMRVTKGSGDLPTGGEPGPRSGAAQVGRSAALMSFLVIVSRITGFFRTWGQSFALGAGMVASCYSVANNLPNQLYEIVVGGMLVTAFLPVYMSVKRREGSEGASRYTSNLVSIVVLLMGAVAVLGFVFAAQLIWTQSFSATSAFDADFAVYLFRFFVIEVVLYSLSSIFSGVLNAERDYFWSTASSIFNNFVTTASFLAYAALVNSNPGLATIILAVGNPLGVLVQVVVQMPSLRRRGIRLSWRIDWRDPNLRETLSIGIPSLVVMVTSFIQTSFQQSTALSVTVSGASVAYYARLWYTLPYAILTVPITTALFTELSDSFAHEDMESYRRQVSAGVAEILFFMVPMAVLLVVFATPLASIVAAGKFTPEQLDMTIAYLYGLAFALPFYSICMYQQKICSSMRSMVLYAVSGCIGTLVQVVLLTFFTPRHLGDLAALFWVAFTSCLFFLVVDAVNFVSIRRRLGPLGLRRVLVSFLVSCALALLGAAVGGGLLWACNTYLGSSDGSVLRSLAYCVLAGVPALVATFGLAVALRVPEARIIGVLLSRVTRRRG